MIEQLKVAGDQLRAAWDNYCRVYSSLQGHGAQMNGPHAHRFSPELSHQLDTELAFISSYEPKIQQLKSIIGRARNQFPNLTPINFLPPEILTRIFHLVVVQPCRFHQDDDSRSITLGYPQSPDYLAQVCSYWRRTAISSPSLWCHIDLTRDHRWYDGLLARAQVHSTRAGGLPVQLHVIDGDKAYPPRIHSDYMKLQDLISNISCQVKTLEIVIIGSFKPFHVRILHGLICQQNAALTKLVIRSEGQHFNSFICSDSPNLMDLDRESPNSNLVLHLTEHEIERVFGRITDLRLKGIFPLWSSSAYHGLVDLRLLSTDIWSSIKKSKLMLILSSSPGLRTLHFGLDIVDATPDEQVTPVYLQHLQVVRIFTCESYPDDPPTTPRLLRLLAPGTHPLRLGLNGFYELTPDLVTDFDSFFARSRVARFYTTATTPPMNLFVRHSAHLEYVILDDVDLEYCTDIDPTLFQVNEPVPPGGLKSLHITKAHIFESELRLMLTYCPTGIALDSCHILRGSLGTSDHTELEQDELLAAFPSVRTQGFEPQDPVTDWDILD